MREIIAAIEMMETIKETKPALQARRKNIEVAEREAEQQRIGVDITYAPRTTTCGVNVNITGIDRWKPFSRPAIPVSGINLPI